MVDKITAVRWLWRADDKWTDFPVATNLLLEQEYLKGTKKIKVDNERFVDISMTPAQIKKNFYCIDCEDKLIIGIQRRYDDEMRRRAVKREAPTLFKGYSFVVCIADDDRRTYIESLLESYKGTCKSGITKRMKAVIAEDPIDPDYEDTIDKAEDWEIPVVNEKWIETSVLNEEAEDFENAAYQITRKSKKRKQPDEGDEDEEEAKPEPAKKAKTTDAAAPASPATTSSASACAPNSSKAILVAKSKWMGVCSAAGSKFPFHLTIISVTDNAFEATVDWPTLNNAKTKAKGTVSQIAATFNFTEYEIVRGDEDVEVPSEYSGKCDSNKAISGAVNESDPEVKGTWKANRVEASDEDEEMEVEEEAESKGLFSTNAVYKGVCFTEYPFEMNITKRKGQDIEGTISWTSLKCKTNFKGTIDGESLKFEETSVATVDPFGGQATEVPMKYSGKVAQAAAGVTLDGTYGNDAAKPTGKFQLAFGAASQ